MQDYDERTYGERIAEIYDQQTPPIERIAIDLLEKLAQGGPVLELGIGTGRIALPLQQRGLQVDGIDASQAMVAKLRQKLGGQEIRIYEGDFAKVEVEGSYALIFVVFNTLFALLSQEEQITCFRNVASRLTPKGSFLVEAFVPDLSRFDRRQRVAAIGVEADRVRLDVSQVNPAAQVVTTQHVFLTADGVKLYPVKLRYSWPAELDLMARMAGLRLKHRWADWQEQAFDDESQKHISVYELAS